MRDQLGSCFGYCCLVPSEDMFLRVKHSQKIEYWVRHDTTFDVARRKLVFDGGRVGGLEVGALMCYR